MREVTQAYFAKESLVVMEEMEEEDEKEGHWEVLGRGEARLPKHLGSSEVRDENTMLFIANFVVDASCCSNLWWNPVRVAHDFASGSHSRHVALRAWRPVQGARPGGERRVLRCHGSC